MNPTVKCNLQSAIDADGKCSYLCVRCGRSVKAPCGLNISAVCRVQPPGDEKPQGGPGTELKSLLARVGIVASPGCKCNARAREMDERGVAWCEANIDTIVGWLAEEHKRQSIKIPFVAQASRIIVKLAIRRAKKKAKKGG